LKFFLFYAGEDLLDTLASPLLAQQHKLSDANRWVTQEGAAVLELNAQRWMRHLEHIHSYHSMCGLWLQVKMLVCA
jgi:hypothetical protein